MKRSNRGLGWFAGTLAALLLVALVPGTAAAAARITFTLGAGTECVGGDAAPSTTARITWKSAGGALKARADVATNQFGGWVLCVPGSNLRTGDTIKVNDGLGARTLTMPQVTLIFDRVNNEFRGKAPANSTGTIYWHSGLYADYYEGEDVASNANGNWSLTPYSDFDLLGGIDGDVDWTTSSGDSFYAHGMAPFIEVTLGRSTFSGGANPNQNVLFKLRDPSTATLKGTDMVTGDEYAYFTGQFVNGQGQPATVVAGNRVLSPVASDLDWIVPHVEGSANVANDHVNGRCHSTDLAALSVRALVFRSGNRIGYVFGGIEQDGSFSMDFGEPPSFMYDPANIRHGDRVQVLCLYETGDIVRLVFRVP